MLSRCVARGRSSEDAAAIREFDGSGITGLGSILGKIAFDGDLIAGFQRVFGPAVPSQRIWRAALTLPFLNDTLVILHVEIDPYVRIEPLDLCNGSVQVDRLILIKFRGE